MEQQSSEKEISTSMEKQIVCAPTSSIYDDLIERPWKKSKSDENDPETLLFEFLYDSHAIDEYNVYYKLFNANFNLGKILAHNSDYLSDQALEFHNLVQARAILYLNKEYVHAIDLVKETTSMISRLNKKFTSMPEDTKLVLVRCPKCKHKCRFFTREAAFIVYLFLKGVDEENEGCKEDEGDEQDEEAFDESLSSHPQEPGDELDIEEQYDCDVEQEQSKNLDVALIRQEIVVLEPSQSSVDRLPTPILPTFPIENDQYIMLSDLQRTFRLREDQLLAILAQTWSFNVGTDDEPLMYKDFVDPEPIFQEMDTCFDSSTALQLCFKETSQGEEPKEEEFLKAQTCVSDPHALEMKADVDDSTIDPLKPIIEEPQSKEETEGSINLWQPKQLVYDENFTIKATKENFVKRSRGSKASDATRDAALKFYIKHLGSPQLLIFHTKFSNYGYMPVFSLKTLSRYLGGYLVPLNANKVMLLHKHAAIEIFGYAYGLQGSLAAHYLTYTGYALSIGVTDPKKLTSGGKRYLLRHGELQDVKEEQDASKKLLENQDINDFEPLFQNP